MKKNNSNASFLFIKGSPLGVTVAGTTSNSGPWSYQLSSPTAIAFDPFGFLYIMDYGNDRVQRWLPGGNYGTTVAAATMNNPYRMRFDRLGNIVICDTDYHRVIQFSITCRKFLKELFSFLPNLLVQ